MFIACSAKQKTAYKIIHVIFYYLKLSGILTKRFKYYKNNMIYDVHKHNTKLFPLARKLDLLSAGTGPMADISGPVSDRNNESSEASGIVGVDAWPPKLERELGVTLNGLIVLL